MSSRSTHVVTNGRISFLFIAEYYPIVYIHYIFFIHTSTDGCLGCFHALATVNDAAMNKWCRYLFLNKFVYLFIYFWLCWVFVDAWGLSPVAASGGYSWLRCAGFSLWWLLLLWSTGCRCAGFSSCGSRALERRLSSCGTRA